MTTLIYLLIANSLISLFFLIFAIIKSDKELMINSLIMLLTPPVGVVCYIGQYLVRKLSRKPKEIPLDEVGFLKDRHDRIIEPDVESEMQAVHLEELFLVSANADKRKRLLNELKKESTINYGAISKALDNEDPESAHYAAAALANAKSEFENELRDYDNLYNRDKENTKLCRDYANRVKDFLDSGILTGIELKRYNYLICNLLTTLPQHTAHDYDLIVTSAIFNNEYEIAGKWALEFHHNETCEKSYLHLLKIYYETGLKENFRTLLAELKKSDIDLSEEGLNLVRFYGR